MYVTKLFSLSISNNFSHSLFSSHYSLTILYFQSFLIYFSVFLNNLATEIKMLNAGVDASDGTVSILLYADDIALIAASEKNLQKMLDTLSAWTDKWLMNIHPDKSQIVHFRKN